MSYHCIYEVTTALSELSLTLVGWLEAEMFLRVKAALGWALLDFRPMDLFLLGIRDMAKQSNQVSTSCLKNQQLLLN